MNRHELRFRLWAQSLAAVWARDGYALIWAGRSTKAGFFPVVGPFRRQLHYDGMNIRSGKRMVGSTFTSAVHVTHYGWITAKSPFRTARLDREIHLIPGDTLSLAFKLELEYD